jgi:hypothetical protein
MCIPILLTIALQSAENYCEKHKEELKQIPIKVGEVAVSSLMFVAYLFSALGRGIAALGRGAICVVTLPYRIAVGCFSLFTSSDNELFAGSTERVDSTSRSHRHHHHRHHPRNKKEE